jgi:phosphonate transport system permease protein
MSGATSPPAYVEAPAPWYVVLQRLLVTVVVVGVLAYGWRLTDLDVIAALRDLGQMGRVLDLLFHPNWDVMSEPPCLEVFVSTPLCGVTKLMIETVFLGIIATVLSIVVAIPLSFLGARNLMSANAVTVAIYGAVRLLFTVIRSIDILIVVILFVVTMGIGTAAGVFALAFHNTGVLGKLYSESIENIDPGPIEALTSTGANRVQVVWFAVLPQIINPFIGLTIYRLDTNVRLAPVIGLVGGGGIGFVLIQYLNLLQYQNAAPILLEIILVVATMDFLSGQIRKRLA